MRRIGLSIAIVLLVLPAASARQSAPASSAQRPAPTFRVEVNYVEIDAVVTDDKGVFVRGLTKEDFELFEDGKPQTITAFSAVDVPVERPDPPLFRQTPVEPDVAANDGEFNGRVLVVVLDDMLTDVRHTARIRAAATQFIRRFVGDNDLAAVIHTSAPASAGQNFTTNRRLLLAAVDKFAGKRVPSAAAATLEQHNLTRSAGREAEPSDPLAIERGARSRNTVDRLRAAADFLAGIRGRRKALIWFSEGIDANIEDPRSSDATVVREAMLDLIGTAQRAGVTFYAVDPRGVGAGMDEALELGPATDDPTARLGMTALLDDVRRAQGTLMTISTETGGFAILGGMDINRQFAKIIEENSSYYLLGYYPAVEKRDGKFRNVDVRMKRPGVRVRHRTGYTAPKGKPEKRSTSAAAATAPSELRAAIDSPLPLGGVPMRVFASPFAGPGDKTAVAIIIEVEAKALKFHPTGTTFSENLEFLIVPVNAAGKALDGAHDQAPLKLSTRTHEVVRTYGLRITRRLDLPPGRYQLKVAARAENANTVGALTYDFEVPDFRKPALSMSGIVVMSALADRMPTAPPQKDFTDVLPMGATALRDFAREDTLFLFADVYSTRAGTPHAVEIKTTATSDAGEVVFTATDQRRTEELQGKTGGFGHSAKFALAQFRPGRYVLRVEARALVSGGTSVAREVEFSVR